MTKDNITEVFPDLVKRYGWRATARSAAFCLLLDLRLGEMFVAHWTGLGLEEVNQISNIARALGWRA
jgi:hypothetical protein